MRNAGRGVAKVDLELLWTAMEGHRKALGFTSWNHVAVEVGVNNGTLRRIEHGVAPDAHNLAAIMWWLGERWWWIQPRPDPEEDT